MLDRTRSNVTISVLRHVFVRTVVFISGQCSHSMRRRRSFGNISGADFLYFCLCLFTSRSRYFVVKSQMKSYMKLYKESLEIIRQLKSLVYIQNEIYGNFVVSLQANFIRNKSELYCLEVVIIALFNSSLEGAGAGGINYTALSW